MKISLFLLVLTFASVYSNSFLKEEKFATDEGRCCCVVVVLLTIYAAWKVFVSVTICRTISLSSSLKNACRSIIVQESCLYRKGY